MPRKLGMVARESTYRKRPRRERNNTTNCKKLYNHRSQIQVKKEQNLFPAHRRVFEFNMRNHDARHHHSHHMQHQNRGFKEQEAVDINISAVAYLSM